MKKMKKFDKYAQNIAYGSNKKIWQVSKWATPK